MNAVEYCLLHGLKLAGPEHPAILCAQESLSYGALAARVGQFRNRPNVAEGSNCHDFQSFTPHTH
jgi:hypothetical protein